MVRAPGGVLGSRRKGTELVCLTEDTVWRWDKGQHSVPASAGATGGPCVGGAMAAVAVVQVMHAGGVLTAGALSPGPERAVSPWGTNPRFF